VSPKRKKLLLFNKICADRKINPAYIKHHRYGYILQLHCSLTFFIHKLTILIIGAGKPFSRI
ncbi:MAG: hypothetical protein RQ936_12370, partial [Gammaproteobacteria bacterium]|nr:hypothetical protein [Gammaproteobacteria bacterium]